MKGHFIGARLSSGSTSEIAVKRPELDERLPPPVNEGLEAKQDSR